MKTESVQKFFQKKFKQKSFQKAYAKVSPLMEIALSITKARELRGLTQTELAKKLHTAQSVVSRIEGGNQNLSVAMLAKMAHVLGCDLLVSLKPRKWAA